MGSSQKDRPIPENEGCDWGTSDLFSDCTELSDAVRIQIQRLSTSSAGTRSGVGTNRFILFENRGDVAIPLRFPGGELLEAAETGETGRGEEGTKTSPTGGSQLHSTCTERLFRDLSTKCKVLCWAPYS